MRNETLSLMLVGFAALMVVLPAGASAQGRFSVDARGGIAVPAGELSEFTEIGPAFGVGIAYWFTPRVAARGRFDTSMLNGKDSDGPGPDGPDANLLHVNAGLEFNLTNPDGSPLRLAVNAGAGASALEVDDVQGVLADFDETYVSVNGGLGIGYAVRRNISIFLDGQWYLTFTDEDDTVAFSQFSDVDPNGFSTASDIQLTAGISFRFN